MEAIGHLAAGIAHDFNNVLAIVTGSVEILQKNLEDENLKGYAEMIFSSAQRGKSVTERLLLFSRKEEPHLSPVKFSDIVRDIREMLVHSLPKTILVEVDDHTRPGMDKIMADPGQIHQILLNITLNAADAIFAKKSSMGRGTIRIKLDNVSWKNLEEVFGQEVKKQQYLCCCIQDDGIGMDSEILARVYDPFFTTKEKGEGTGLGLSVAYGIVKSHHGYINVTSTPEKGSTFFIYFPIIQMDEKKDYSQKLKVEEDVKYMGTILVIDDEKDLRQLLNDVLKAHGYNVLEAADGFEAVEVYRDNAEKIDVVICDLGLPGKGGDEVFFELRDINENVRMIFITGYMNPKQKDRLLQAGVDDFLHKPFELVELVDRINKIIGE
jgi:CheY-like chemotaxis protein